MKKWNAPVVEEMNINETANGIFNHYVETFILMNDSLAETKGETATTPDTLS